MKCIALALAAVMALSLTACENKVAKKEVKTGTDVVQPAAEKAPADGTATPAPAENPAPAGNAPAQ